MRWKGWAPWIAGIAVVVVVTFLVQFFGAIGNALAAAASAVAAIAAFASARESSGAARDALRALSYATKPTISVQMFGDDSEDSRLLIINESPNKIGRLRVSAKYRDGNVETHEYGVVEGVPRFGAPATGRVSHPVPNRGRNSGADKFTVEYWGAHGPTGWRQIHKWNHTYSDGPLPDGTKTSSYSRASDSELESEIS